MDNIGGAEVVTLTLVRELGADLYTTNIDNEKIIKMGFSDVLDRVFSLGKIPKKAPFRQQISFWKFRKLNLSGKYDFFIISGDWAMSGSVNNKPNMWYVHSPLNELWQFNDFIKKEILSYWKILPFNVWVWFNRRLTIKYASFVDSWVCNSNNTQKRILKFYSKKALVINPPIDVNKYKIVSSKDYWLSVNRLVTHKRIEIQIEAFRKLPNEELIIVGSYEKGVSQFEEYKRKLEKIKPDNVKFLHWVADGDLKNLYEGCKGFLSTAKDEDFGMTVVEAMAAGKPVIAPNEGGYRETVTDQTGVLINDINDTKLMLAIKKVSNNLSIDKSFYKKNCINRSQNFNTSVFVNKIKKEINKYVK